MQRLYPLVGGRHPSNLYKHFEGLIRRHWKRWVPSPLRSEVNFEDVLYSIFALAAAYPAGAYTSALGALIRAKNLPQFKYQGHYRKRLNGSELHNLGNSAVDELLSLFRERCRLSEARKISEFNRLESFVEALKTEFELAVVTLNSDNILYRALPGIETGFDPVTRRFDERRIFDRSEWTCMLHMHGSVHFDMGTPKGPDLHEIYWQPDISALIGQNASGRSTRPNPEGAVFPTSAIVAGYGKTTQILRRPFRSYYSELDRLVFQCDAVLFAGYGFGDPHLNIAFERFHDSRNRHVVIIHRAKQGSMTLGGAGVNNLTTAIRNTFYTDLQSMRWLGHSMPSIVDSLLEAKEFEVSNNPNTPLSVWYNGMLEACDHPAKVIARLT